MKHLAAVKKTLVKSLMKQLVAKELHISFFFSPNLRIIHLEKKILFGKNKKRKKPQVSLRNVKKKICDENFEVKAASSASFRKTFS